MGEFGLGIALLSDVIWVGLLTLWGGFWRCDQRLEPQPNDQHSEKLSAPVPCTDLAATESLPVVYAVVPARNEADMVPQSVRSLLQQDYPGPFHIVLVDDHSTDGTGAVAHQTAAALGQADQLTVLPAAALPPGWTGKLWAMEQGDRYTQTRSLQADYLWFTDADIEHDRGNLSRLVAKATQNHLDLVSLMVLLRCNSFWEKLLIPAFVFFFQKLYPFPLVNQPHSRIAAAAGGCLLIRRQALNRIGGLQILRQALIDDCSLAIAVKRGDQEPSAAQHPIWLGLTQTTRSLRPYESLETIWQMVARTAYTQLHYSPLLLVGTVVGMTLVYLVAPIATMTGLLTANWLLCGAGLGGWALMTLAYWPTIRLYGLSPIWAIALPAIALLYNLMTIDSALQHERGQGGAWKGRVYPSQDS